MNHASCSIYKVAPTIRSFVVGMTALFLSHTAVASPTFGIITAMPEEAHYIRSQMQHPEEKKIGLYRHTFGEINNMRVVLLISGIGAINTAVATSHMIEKINPDYLLFSGTAGGMNKTLRVGDVIILEQAFLFGIGDPNAAIPTWPSDKKNPAREIVDPMVYKTPPALLERVNKEALVVEIYSYTAEGKRIPSHIRKGNMATTQYFPIDPLNTPKMKALQIDTVDMETGSFMKTCWLYEKPCISFRGVSDLIALPSKEDTYYNTWNVQNSLLASDNTAKVLVHYLSLFNPSKKQKQ